MDNVITADFTRPQSTLYAEVAAFIGYEAMLEFDKLLAEAARQEAGRSWDVANDHDATQEIPECSMLFLSQAH